MTKPTPSFWQEEARRYAANSSHWRDRSDKQRALLIQVNELLEKIERRYMLQEDDHGELRAIIAMIAEATK